jgi:uncharacterized protein YbjT (DUF2867 family)
MRVAVIGCTGLVGRHATKALQHAGHDAVVVARYTGIDVIAGTGLDAALAGIEAVIDVTNTAASDAEAAREFFAAATGQLLAEVATGTPQNRMLELAGPETQDLVDMARRTLPARGHSVRLVPSWRAGQFSVEMAGEVLLPGPDTLD